jgi:tetratricopeptide (TPR) repeat protein/predicted Zn-dependent protease with MMP-like domain
VRATLQLLPPGTLDGLSRVVLCLGAEYQRDLVEAEVGYGEPDPLLGRLGSNSLPDVYTGACLGTYFSHDASIWLYAYVYHAATMPDWELRELYLRLQMLETLMHEVAHHWDGTACDVRGRWVDRPEGKSEWSARKRAYQWTQQFVIPYLEQSYPAATRALVEWVSQHGGVALPLSKLVNHPDENLFSTGSAVESLFSACDQGLSPQEARLEFARDLHYAQRFDDALQCLAAILADRPEDSTVRTLQADIYEHQERYEQAEHIARAVVTEAPAYADARDILVDVYRAQGQWHELEAAATGVIELVQADGKKPVSALCARTCARIELGDVAGATADIQEIQRITGTGRTSSEAVASLRALLLLRTEQYEEALRIAQSLLQRPRGSLPWCGMLLAVRYEAAHRLGRPQEAATLSARAAKLLRRHGHGQWIDRLVADYGLRIWSKNRT